MNINKFSLSCSLQLLFTSLLDTRVSFKSSSAVYRIVSPIEERKKVTRGFFGEICWVRDRKNSLFRENGGALL
jgi:hypothetical protein